MCTPEQTNKCNAYIRAHLKKKHNTFKNAHTYTFYIIHTCVYGKEGTLYEGMRNANLYTCTYKTVEIVYKQAGKEEHLTYDR